MRVRFISILLPLLSLGIGFTEACSSNDDKPPAPDSSELFTSTRPPPTPDKLRGVWDVNNNQGGGTNTTRLLFTENYVVGAARCVASGASDSVIAGGSADLSTAGLDAPSGTLKMGSLNFTNGACNLSLAGGTYNFAIQERSLTLSAPNGTASVTFKKVAD